MKPKIYLAGKITNNWWRNEILANGTERETRTPGISIFNEKNDYYDSEYDTGDFIVVGPHSIACDHQCFHNIEDGALHAANYEYEPNDTVLSKDILKACTHQIDKADIVFAYIDDKDAYGTLFELGYAYNHYKHTYIIFKTNELAKLNWFTAQAARKTYILENDDVTLSDIFNEVLNIYDKK